MNRHWVALIMAVAALASGAAAAGGIDPKPLAALRQAIDRQEYPKTTSVLIIHHGKLAFERYFGEGSKQRLNNTRSATKFLTSLALGSAVRRASRSDQNYGYFVFEENYVTACGVQLPCGKKAFVTKVETRS
jgi:hypothetical protein